MNKAITDGLVLMPPTFSAGLNLWSRGDGTPGSGSYQGQANAALVTNDQDFAGCLEVQKVDAVQKVRSFAQTPMQPGLYLRVTARVKAVSGNLPSVRIAAWAGDAGGANVVAAPQTGPAVPLTSYGEVVTISAIIAPAARQGVDLAWGSVPVYGHFGIDLTGANGGVVRIDDLVVEDATDVFLRKMMDWVDVRDYGALGNGTTNDAAAFAAADADADGRAILVPEGVFRLTSDVAISNRIRFEGTLSMPANRRLTLTRNFDLDTYASAFGSELEGFRRALQALFYFNDHNTLDLSGRRVDLTGPLDVATIAGLTSFTSRRVLRNGALNALPGPGWATDTVTSVATYAPASPVTLTGVANVANIPVGALVEGTGVGREVYVRSKNVGAGTVQLSQPLWGAAGTRTYTFKRFKYMLDFGGFELLSRFEIEDVEFNALGLCSCVLLPVTGLTFRFMSNTFNRPLDRGISSTGTGCQGMFIDMCQFLSNESALPAQTRTSIAVNVNGNDTKIRNNRVVRFAHFAVMNGTGHMVFDNHFFQGDDEAVGVRRAGLIFTQTNVSTVVSGNYVDNCFIEWGNEHDAAPEWNGEFSFGGLNVVGNIFIASNVTTAFRFVVVKPYGPGHYLNGFSMVSNSFRVVSATTARVEMVDTTLASLDFAKSFNVRVEGNSFNNVTQQVMNPVVVTHTQNTAADTWNVGAGGFIPFDARTRMVEAVMPEGPIINAASAVRYVQPNATVGTGAGGNEVQLRWGEALRGKVVVRMRMDLPG
ncbi:MAG: glycosyl hydrolase family 28-related protein [Tabrizicola sp.]|uniref:glycosyl hydrolase family 28-related protein n=1 Tax=Tabrizicola sp. TaxID=2005166 RepID=UPI00273762DD|nr:glycosyl hydrolase family 28-related protein [Tabrizicola sp.]MDP3264877.1 glycosyl hydrolase family 28-related protein [Tabrizicola sp.]MDP3647612.1 glycosyl hydrolase family 28-related protein [Paracoccaceae bacterium]MDZ4069741.1 glycosyl hydrolase family 28-related protein [Tabrizicola sp.]